MNKYLYSPSMKGFYHTDIHGKNIPEDAVSITDEEHAALMEAQSKGKRITPGPDGKPVAVDPPPPPLPTVQDIQREEVRRLSGTDWLVIRKAETGEAVPEEIAAYRAAVREAATALCSKRSIPVDYYHDQYWPVLNAGAGTGFSRSRKKGA